MERQETGLVLAYCRVKDMGPCGMGEWINEGQQKQKERKIGLKGYLARDGLKTRNTYKDFSKETWLC